MNKLRMIVLTFLLVLTLIFYFSWNLFQYAMTPRNTKQKTVLIDILPYQKFIEISDNLYQSGMIMDPFKFKLLARIKGYDKRIKAGEYSLAPSMTPAEILEVLANGKIFLHKFTEPEGYNLNQIAPLVAETNLITASEFIKTATNADFVNKKGIPADTFEGYLFPETYYFPKGVTAKQIILSMLERFWSVFTPEWKKRSETLGLSIHQIVTLASIIEKETGVSVERPMVSSVFHNRLKRRMRLESDPTVIYGIKDYDGKITREHLRAQTPYNTYRIDGLPPGPIANPGAKSLEAALYPAETSFLYFVSKGDHSHEFSTNLADHNRAVQKYQLHHN